MVRCILTTLVVLFALQLHYSYAKGDCMEKIISIDGVYGISHCVAEINLLFAGGFAFRDDREPTIQCARLRYANVDGVDTIAAHVVGSVIVGPVAQSFAMKNTKVSVLPDRELDIDIMPLTAHVQIDVNCRCWNSEATEDAWVAGNLTATKYVRLYIVPEALDDTEPPDADEVEYSHSPLTTHALLPSVHGVTATPVADTVMIHGWYVEYTKREVAGTLLDISDLSCARRDTMFVRLRYSRPGYSLVSIKRKVNVRIIDGAEYLLRTGDDDQYLLPRSGKRLSLIPKLSAGDRFLSWGSSNPRLHERKEILLTIDSRPDDPDEYDVWVQTTTDVANSPKEYQQSFHRVVVRDGQACIRGVAGDDSVIRCYDLQGREYGHVDMIVMQRPDDLVIYPRLSAGVYILTISGVHGHLIAMLNVP